MAGPVTAWDEFVGQLGDVPHLPDALCKGHPEPFDESEAGDDPEDTVERISFAISACRRCPAQNACRSWFDGLPPKHQPGGVVAGLFNGKELTMAETDLPMLAAPRRVSTNVFGRRIFDTFGDIEPCVEDDGCVAMPLRLIRDQLDGWRIEVGPYTLGADDIERLRAAIFAWDDAIGTSRS